MIRARTDNKRLNYTFLLPEVLWLIYIAWDRLGSGLGFEFQTLWLHCSGKSRISQKRRGRKPLNWGRKPIIWQNFHWKLDREIGQRGAYVPGAPLGSVLCRTCSHCTDSDFSLFLYRTGIRVRVWVRVCTRVRVRQCKWATIEITNFAVRIGWVL